MKVILINIFVMYFDLCLYILKVVQFSMVKTHKEMRI